MDIVGEKEREKEEEGSEGEVDHVGSGRILVFMSAGCPHCVRSKDLLLKKGQDVFQVDLNVYPEMREEMVAKTGRKTVPQIFFNEKHIGGADDLFSLEDEKVLDELLKKLNETPPIPLPPCATQVNPVIAISSLSSLRKSLFEVLHQPENPILEEEHDVALMSIVEEIKGRLGEENNKMKLKTHRFKMKFVHKSFRGNWLIEHLAKMTKLSFSVCLKLAQLMLDARYIVRVGSRATLFDSGSGSCYMFWDSKYKNILNYPRPSEKYTPVFQKKQKKQKKKKGASPREKIAPPPSNPEEATKLAEEISMLILSIRDKFVSYDGRSVDYKGVRHHALFAVYAHKTLQLQKLDLTHLKPKEKKAFFINVYNALVIHASVAVGPPRNLIERAAFFGGMCYIIGRYKYSLSDIEHGILRANQKPPGLFPSHPFSSSDPRRKFSLSMRDFDPRIHFALVCGAKSCPPIRVFSPRNVDQALQWATEGFCLEEVQIREDKRKVKMSMLFKWYHADFGKTDAEMLKWISQFLPPEHALQETFKVSYFTYSWDQNGRGYDEDKGQFVAIDSSTVNSISDTEGFDSSSWQLGMRSSNALVSEATHSTDSPTHTETDDDLTLVLK